MRFYKLISLFALSRLFPRPARAMKRDATDSRVAVVAYDYTLNLKQRVMSIDWEVSGCGEHRLEGSEPVESHPPEYQADGTPEESSLCGPFNRAVDVYLDSPSNKVLSYNPNDLPVDPIRGPLPIRELTGFRTDHQLRPSGHSIDSYVFHTFAFAIDPATNLSVGIAQFTVASSLGRLATTSGTLVGWASTHGDGSSSTTGGIEPLTLEVVYHHPHISVFTKCALVTSWALTLVSVYISLGAIAKGRVESTTFMLHAITALAILGLWEGWLESELFGALQGYLGFCIQIVTVAVCSMVSVHLAAKPAQAPWQPEKP